MGCNSYRYQGSKSEMIDRASKDETCVAFNTLGFFKNNITNLTSSQYMGIHDGIYIKKTFYDEYCKKTTT